MSTPTKSTKLDIKKITILLSENVEKFMQQTKLGKGQLVSFNNVKGEFTIKNIHPNMKQIFVVNSNGDIKCKNIKDIIRLDRKDVLVETVTYSPQEIKDVLWNSFKEKVKDIKTNPNNIYSYTVIPEEDFSIDDANNLLGDLWDTDMFDIEVLSNGNIKIDFLIDTLQENMNIVGYPIAKKDEPLKTYLQFHNELLDWYRTHRENSTAPRPHVISIIYDEYEKDWNKLNNNKMKENIFNTAQMGGVTNSKGTAGYINNTSQQDADYAKSIRSRLTIGDEVIANGENGDMLFAGTVNYINGNTVGIIDNDGEVKEFARNIISKVGSVNENKLRSIIREEIKKILKNK